MLVISNHVKSIGMDYPKDSIVRVNVAWVKTEEDLKKVLDGLIYQKVYLDFPTGRTKPPVPTLSIGEVINIAKNYSNIVFFAFSNAEDKNIIQLIRQAVPKNIKLIPKIESANGIRALEDIINCAETDTVMLDQEDLYSNCKNDPFILKQFLDAFNEKAQTLKLKVLRLSGVIFHCED